MPKGKIPSIKITEGMTPTAGRLTMPIGTFLNQSGSEWGAPNQPFQFNRPTTSFDNPATQGQGALSVPQINTPSAPGGQPLPNFVPMQNGFDRMFNPQRFDQMGSQLYDPSGNVVSQYRVETKLPNGSTQIKFNPVAYDKTGAKFIYDESKGTYVREQNKTFSSAQSSPTVGNFVYGEQPSTLDVRTALSLFPGRSINEVRETLAAKGYELSPQGTFVLSGNQQQQSGQSPSLSFYKDERGRPFVNVANVGADLKYGEVVNAANGVVRGGLSDTAAGEKQYSVTSRQTLNKKLEAKGAYKWVKQTFKDENGNWQARYTKVLRAPYTRQYRKQQQGKREKAAKSTAQTVQGQNFNQLVTLRAKYG